MNAIHKRHMIQLFALLAIVVVSGCGLTKRIPDDAIAVVGDEAITPADVTAMLEDMSLDPNDRQLRAQMVNQWVDREILIQEARRRGLHRDKEIQERINDLREEMMINRLYEDAIRVPLPTDEEVVAYWQDHTGEFTRVTDEVQLIIAYAPSRNTAWAIRNGLDQSRSDTELMVSYSEISFDTTNFVSVERLPRQVNRAIDPLRSGQASLPFQLEGRWLVVRLLARERAGKTRPLDEMMPIIRAQLHAEERARARMSFISGLRRESRRHGRVQINTPGILNMEMNPSISDSLGAGHVPGESGTDGDGDRTIEGADTFDAAGAVSEPSGAVPGADISQGSDE
jgi:peptidyl-prolyl cis-trans isomerase C